jgi:thioredoxin-related protein
MVLTLERTANIVLIICALAMGGASAKQFWRGSPVNAARDVYSIGEKAPLLKNVQYADHDETLLMFINSECQYCTASMSFYKRMTEAQRQAGGALQFVALSTEESASLQAYLDKHGLVVDSAVSVDTSGLKFRSTPTLIAVNRDGRVLNEWVGQIASAREEEVMEVLKLPVQ